MTKHAFHWIADDLWTAESHFLALGCKGSLRMTIVRQNDDLLLYSPVRLTKEQVTEVDRLGRVSVILAPNLFHHMFLRESMVHWPGARVLVPDGLAEKIGGIARAEVVTADTDFGPSLEHFTVTGHGLRETILYHRPSETLITADLLYNYTPKQYFAEKLWFRLVGGYGRPGVAFYHRFSIKDRSSLVGMTQWVAARDIQRVIMSHGEIVTDPAAGTIFVDAWNKLLRLDR